MAEFLEVMKQKKRMCKKYTGGGICQSIDYNICPLKGHELCSKPIALMNVDKIQEGEEVIMRWAAENHEPVYPTWGEWLLKIGAAKRVPVGDPWPVEMADGSMLEPAYDIVVRENERIPADIAKKLGLEPKEG